MNTTDINTRIGRIAARTDMLISHTSKAMREGDGLSGKQALAVAAAASYIATEAAAIVAEALRVAPALVDRDTADAYAEGRRDGAEYGAREPV